MKIAGKSMGDWYQKLKWYAVFLLVLASLYICFRVYLADRIPGYVTLVPEQNEFQVIHDLTDQVTVEQSFSCDWDFDFITLEFSDHEQEMAGEIQLELYDGAGELILQERLRNDGIHYGKPVCLTLQDAGRGRAGETYLIRLTQQGTGENALGLYGYAVNAENEARAAVVNGEAQPYAVSIGVHMNTDMLFVLVRVMFFLAVMGLAVTIYMSQKEKISEENLFLAVAVPFGLCMLLVLCDNNVADYQAHYGKTYQGANFLLGKGDRDNAGSTYMRTEDLYNGQEKDYFRDPAREAWVVFHDWAWFAQKEGMEQSTAFFKPSNGGTILAYLPNVLGMTVGRLLHLGTYPMVYLAKICGFLVYLTICYWAIRRTPVLKTAFALTAALPISLSNAAGITYDTMTISATLLMCAYIFLWWERDLKKTEWLTLGAAVVFVGACKGGVFLPLVFLLFLVPKSRFRLSKRKILTGIVFLCAGITCFLIKYGDYLMYALRATASSDNPATRYGSGYCFVYPLSFIKMMVRTIYSMGDKYIGQLIGYRLGWTDADVEWMIIIPFLILLLTSGVRKEGETVLQGKKRLFLLSLLLAEFVGMHIVLMSDTPVGWQTVFGVQGRYFVALIPLIVLAFRENSVLRKKGSERKLYVCFSIMQITYLFSYVDKAFGR